MGEKRLPDKSIPRGHYARKVVQANQNDQVPIFRFNNSVSLSPCPFHSTYSLPCCVSFVIVTRMVVAMSILILSSSRGKPIMENKAYARCANIKATNVPKLI
jgi:hypothetical protein